MAETFNPNGYTKQQIANALAEVPLLMSNVMNITLRVDTLETEEPKNKIKDRAAFVFGECPAGGSLEKTFTLHAEQIAKADGNPVVAVSPILTSSETYNPDLQYYGYIIHNGGDTDGTVVFGVRNNGASAAPVGKVQVVVL